MISPTAVLVLVLAPPRSPRRTSWNPGGTLVEPYLRAAPDHPEPGLRPQSFQPGLWGMTTSVIQQKGLPKDYFLHKGGFPQVSQKWLEKPRVIPQPCFQLLGKNEDAEPSSPFDSRGRRAPGRRGRKRRRGGGVLGRQDQVLLALRDHHHLGWEKNSIPSCFCVHVFCC